jgi:Ca2+-transporting ATPase
MRTTIVARAVPDHKLRIVEALKARGEVVVMTGDGVNDAPALKAAHVGVAMGERGTEVAREASGMVVTDDDFGSIVDGVRMGRRIFDNLRRATAYIVAVHVPVSGLAVLPVIMGWELVLLPLHIIFLELIIDPACSLVFESEPEEDGVMARPPRPKQGALLPRRLVWLAVLQGASVLAASVAVLLWARTLSDSVEYARTLAFCCLVSGNLGLIMVNRSFRHSFLGTLATRNVALWSMLIGASVVLALAVVLPVARDILHFALPSGTELAIAVGAGLLSLGWFELLKIARPASLEDIAATSRHSRGHA